MQLLTKNLEQLSDSISQISEEFKQRAIKQVDTALTLRNWIIGFLIAEYELNGSDRAVYGEKLYAELARKLKDIKGLTISALYNCRLFYRVYHEIGQILSQHLQLIDFKDKNILQTLSVKFISSANYESKPKYAPDIAVLVNRLSYSHFVELISLDPPLKRHFYEVEILKNNLSVRDLKRSINSMLYERTGLSTDKELMLEKQLQNQKLDINEIIKNPYVLEFLNLEEKAQFSEVDLEQSIINNLQKFLLEAGRGFCFEARQKRITFDNTHYYIDLVFYHRILKCHLLIDLKLGEFTHADSGQMNVYLNYYKNEEHCTGDNPPIGIILTAGKNETLVKYATGGLSDQIFVSKYLVKLPSEDELRRIIDMEVKKL